MSAYMKQGMYPQVRHLILHVVCTSHGPADYVVQTAVPTWPLQVITLYCCTLCTVIIKHCMVSQQSATHGLDSICRYFVGAEPVYTLLQLKGISAVQVLQVFNDMYTAGLQPNIMTYITLMSAYAKLGEWQRAVQLIDHMCQPQVMLAVLITCALSAGLPIMCML